MKTKLGLFLGALLALAGFVGCGDGGTTTGTAATGGGGAGGGGTGGGGTGGTGGAMGGSGGGMAMPSCPDYCTAIQKNCVSDATNKNAQYGEEKACLGICAHFDVGMSADTMGDTLGCREYHAGAAAMDAKTHCPHAGPLGGGMCATSDCAAFCKLAVAVCGTQPTPPYADEAACMTACAAFTDTKTIPYDATITSGDSLACRTYHLTVASEDAASATTHCVHIGEKSDPCQ